MGKSKLPLKFSIFKYVAEANRPVTAEDILRDLEEQYKGERQFNKERIELYLSALVCVSMISEADIDFNNAGEVTVSYQLLELGRTRLKYLPKEAGIA